MPGYPNERHGFWAVFVTRHSVLIVPAAPCCDATVTAAVWSAHKAIAGVDELADVLGAGPVMVAAGVRWVEAGDVEACAVGTGPASCAPPRQPATRDARARIEISALVMR